MDQKLERLEKLTENKKLKSIVMDGVKSGKEDKVKNVVMDGVKTGKVGKLQNCNSTDAEGEKLLIAFWCSISRGLMRCEIAATECEKNMSRCEIAGKFSSGVPDVTDGRAVTNNN